MTVVYIGEITYIMYYSSNLLTNQIHSPVLSEASYTSSKTKTMTLQCISLQARRLLWFIAMATTNPYSRAPLATCWSGNTILLSYSHHTHSPCILLCIRQIYWLHVIAQGSATGVNSSSVQTYSYIDVSSGHWYWIQLEGETLRGCKTILPLRVAYKV